MQDAADDKKETEGRNELCTIMCVSVGVCFVLFLFFNIFIINIIMFYYFILGYIYVHV